jgi:hypothetical protein
MVGVINPNSTQTLDAQIRAAHAADFALAPGDPIPREASPTLVPPSGARDHHVPKISDGAIAGIVAGGAIFIGICVWLLLCLLRRKVAESGTGTRRDTANPPTDPVGQGGFVSPISPIQPFDRGYPPNPPSYPTPYPYSANL